MVYKISKVSVWQSKPMVSKVKNDAIPHNDIFLPE
jgi:hypothetical protein